MKKLLIALPIFAISSFAVAQSTEVNIETYGLKSSKTTMEYTKNEAHCDRCPGSSTTKTFSSQNLKGSHTEEQSGMTFKYGDTTLPTAYDWYERTSSLYLKTHVQAPGWVQGTWGNASQSTNIEHSSLVHFNTYSTVSPLHFKLDTKYTHNSIVNSPNDYSSYYTTYSVELDKIGKDNSVTSIAKINLQELFDKKHTIDADSLGLSFTGLLENNANYRLKINTKAYNNGLLNIGNTPIVTETLLQFSDEAYATSEVPLPAAAWLFGSALAGLAFKKRK